MVQSNSIVPDSSRMERIVDVSKLPVSLARWRQRTFSNLNVAPWLEPGQESPAADGNDPVSANAQAQSASNILKPTLRNKNQLFERNTEKWNNNKFLTIFNETISKQR